MGTFGKEVDARSSHHSACVGKSALAIAVAMAIAAANSPVHAQTQQTDQQQDSQQQGLQLQEVVVTAQRREQNLQDVPISVAVFTQEKMDIQGVRDMDDIAKFTPSLTFSKSDGLRSLNSSISIRGVTTGSGAPTTGIYINDTPIVARNITASGGSNGTAYPNLFDLERVEVLRGPQGTLYGSGSEGGTVRFISPTPSLTDSSMYVRAGASAMSGGGPGYEMGVAGGMPIITDKLGFRASVSTSQTGGYIDHGNFYTGLVDEKNYNWERNWSVRLALRWAPTKNLEISPTVFHQEHEARGLNSFYLPDDIPNQRLGLKPGDDGYIDTSPGSYYDRHHAGGWANYGHFGQDALNGGYVDASRTIPDAKQYMDLDSLDIKYSLPKVDMSYNASVYENRLKSYSDFSSVLLGTWSDIVASDFTPFPADPALIAPNYGSNKNRSFTQEFRVQNSTPNARFEWVAGVYWQELHLSVQNYNYVPNFALLFRDLITPSPCTDIADCNAWLLSNVGVASHDGVYPVWVHNAADSNQQAAYGQVDFHATDHLTLTLGERYSRMQYNEHSYKAGLYYGADGKNINGDAKVSATTPKFGLKWTTDGGAMYYFTAAKGFRNGGSNPPMANAQCAARLKSAWNIDKPPLLYKPDSVWSYELGTKFRAINNRLTVDADVYEIKWSDMIRSISIGGNCILSFMTNLGTAQSRGAELDLQFSATDNLLLSLNGGYAKVESGETIPVPSAADPTKPKIDSQGREVLITREGAILPGSHTTATLAAQYAFKAFDRPSYARLDYTYSGSPSKGDNWDPQSSQYDGAADLFETPSIETANLRIGTKLSDWNVSLYVNNLTNSQPIFKFRQQDGVAWMSGSTITPRTAGVTAVLRY